MDILVKYFVERAGAELAFRAPEAIFVEDVKDRLHYSDKEKPDAEMSAIIDKVTLILRGQMQPNPIWDTDTAAA